MTAMAREQHHRTPYIGEGRDGCRRSAQIDREEAEMLHRDDPRRAELLASAVRWAQQERVTCPDCGDSTVYSEWHEGYGDDTIPRAHCDRCGLDY